jgi:hypothetical protein
MVIQTRVGIKIEKPAGDREQFSLKALSIKIINFPAKINLSFSFHKTFIFQLNKLNKHKT